MNRHLRAGVLAAAAGLAAGLIPTAASAATVSIGRNFAGECFLADGDVPGVSGFEFANETVVVISTGAVNVTCTGRLPDGVTPPAKTIVASVPCAGDDGAGHGRVTITTSGKAGLHCRIPAAP